MDITWLRTGAFKFAASIVEPKSRFRRPALEAGQPARHFYRASTRRKVPTLGQVDLDADQRTTGFLRSHVFAVVRRQDWRSKAVKRRRDLLCDKTSLIDEARR
jgi:hypothetical protein